MIRRFLPLILPCLLVFAYAALSYGFWRKDSVGSAMRELPAVVLGGETIVPSHPAGLEPGDPDFYWRVSLTPESLARLGPLDLAHGCGETAPPEEAWLPLPTGTAFGAFTAAPQLPDLPEDENGTESLRLWLRARKGDLAPLGIDLAP